MSVETKHALRSGICAVYNKDVGPSWQDMENYEATYLNQTKLWINSFCQLIIL